MPNIQIGLKGVEEMVVERQDLASMMGNIGAEVLSPPFACFRQGKDTRGRNNTPL